MFKKYCKYMFSSNTSGVHTDYSTIDLDCLYQNVCYLASQNFGKKATYFFMVETHL